MAGYVVSGPVVVLPTRDGSERYLYRHAPIDSEAFTEEGIKHALSIGLISKVEKEKAAAASTPSAAEKRAAAKQAAADKKAAADAAAAQKQADDDAAKAAAAAAE